MLDEILSWHTYSEREKEAVLVKCRSRQKGSN
ncbi:hypothetical protein [Pseudoalteromonas citrea]